MDIFSFFNLNGSLFIIMRGHWYRYIIVILFSCVVLSLDFLLTTSIPFVFEQFQVVVTGSIKDLRTDFLVICLLIVFRPLIGFLIISFQAYFTQKIQRQIEDDLAKKLVVTFQNDPKKQTSEKAANLIITNARYFTDNFLIPLARAITEIGSLIFVGAGLLVVFPFPTLIFFISMFILLFLFYIISRQTIRQQGKIMIFSIEKIINLAKSGFADKRLLRTNKSGSLKPSSKLISILDSKMTAAFILCSFSQGAKYIVEFCALIGFGLASLYIIATSPAELGTFVSIFVYAAMRMLPSVSSIISFIQGRENAFHAMDELAAELNENSR